MKSITVETKPAVKTKTAKTAMFVSFGYNLETVERIKKLPQEARIYLPQEKAWEVPTRYLPNLVAIFQDYKVTLKGKVTSRVKKAVENSPTFDQVDYSNFEFKTKPFAHQLESFDYAKDHNRFLLGDEQGLGKTKQSIDIAVARKHQFKHTLIVCGVNSVKWNWFNEVHKHSNEKAHVLGTRYKADGNPKKVNAVKDRVTDLTDRDEYFLITNIETLRDKKFQEQVEKLTKDGTIGMVIIDEIHKGKNAQSAQGKAIHKLASFYKIALTGTPMMNTPTDLYNVLKWLGEENGSFYKFRNRYCVMGGYGGHEVIAHRNLEELKQRLNLVQLRRLKENTLDLPPKIRQTEYVELTPIQENLYKMVKNEIVSQINDIKLSPNPLAQLTRLRQVTASPDILDNEIPITESAKMSRLWDIVDENAGSGRKTIIFSNWTEVTKRTRDLLAEFNPAYVVGGSDVDSEVAKFQQQDDCKVIIGTIGKMGTGLNLTAASTVIFLDKPWNLATQEQGEDRAHRIGTKGTVNIISLVAKDTIDERVETLIMNKGKMSQALVDGKFGNLDKAEVLNFLLS